MVDETVGEHDPAILIDQREAPSAQPVVVPVVALRELLLAAKVRDGDEEVGVVGRLHAVLDSVAARMELRADGPVVELKGGEIAVGQRDHLRPARSLALGHRGFHHRLCLELRVGEDQRLVPLAHNERLDFGDAGRLAGPGECTRRNCRPVSVTVVNSATCPASSSAKRKS